MHARRTAIATIQQMGSGTAVIAAKDTMEILTLDAQVCISLHFHETLYVCINLHFHETLHTYAHKKHMDIHINILVYQISPAIHMRYVWLCTKYMEIYT